jgi:hypothetical protein
MPSRFAEVGKICFEMFFLSLFAADTAASPSFAVQTFARHDVLMRVRPLS